LQVQFNIKPEERSGTTNTLLLLSLFSMAISVIFAILSFLPITYPVPGRRAFERLIEISQSGQPVALDVAKDRISELVQIRQRNRRKARALLAAIGAFGVAVIFIILAILAATL
jgi:hypothetical protein